MEAPAVQESPQEISKPQQTEPEPQNKSPEVQQPEEPESEESPKSELITEKIKAITGPGGKLKSSRSLPTREDVIREIKKETKVEKKVEAPIGGEKEFSLHDVQDRWEEFLVKRKEQSSKESESMILKQPWTLNENTITLQLSNAVEEDILQSFHTDLVGFLRHSLDNKKIEVRSEVKEVAKGDLLYTNKDKYEHLLKINPKLKDLTERLGLDPDF